MSVKTKKSKPPSGQTDEVSNNSKNKGEGKEVANGKFGKKAVEDTFALLLKEIFYLAKEKLIVNGYRRILKSIRLAHYRYSGQAVAILGPPASGKTTLLKLLADQRISQETLAAYSKTELESHKGISAKFNLNVEAGEPLKFNFKLKKNSDVGGEKYLRDSHWKDVIEDVSVVIYMIDATMFIEDESAVNQEHVSSEYRDRVLSDFEWIRDNYQLLREDFSVVFAFNKIDRLCDVTSYRSFAKENSKFIESLKEQIAGRWPDHLKDHLNGGVFLSVLDPGLRAFTMNGLISCFVGDDLMKLLKEVEPEA